MCTITAGQPGSFRRAGAMSYKWTRTEDWHIARFREKNLDDCDEDAKAMVAQIDLLPRGSKVALSFRGVEWISSRVLGLILAVQAAVDKRGGEFAITSPSEKLMEALKITR